MRKALTPKAKEWIQQTKEKVELAIIQNGWETQTFKTVINMRFIYKDGRIRDNTNSFKLLMDVLEKAGIYINDYWALPRVIDFQVDKASDENYIILEIEKWRDSNE